MLMSVRNPISAQEVSDVIRKLATESDKVLVAFFDWETGIMVRATGKLELRKGSVCVVHGGGTSSVSETLFFVTSLEKLQQTPAELADPEMFKYTPCAAFDVVDLRFSFGVLFGFASGSLLALLDVSSEPNR
jgi:hypothetical protein